MNLPKGIALARIAIYVVLGLLAVHFIRSLGTGITPLDAWLASGKAQHETVAKLLQRDAQDRQQALQAASRARELAQQSQGAMDRFQALAGAFRAHLDSEHTHPDTAAFQTVVRACWDALTLCRARGDSLAVSDSLNRGRADSLKAALLRSDSSLAAGLRVATCKWLFIPCPSRTRALEYGVVLGLLGGYVVFKH
jgi:hypothetical protein